MLLPLSALHNPSPRPHLQTTFFPGAAKGDETLTRAATWKIVRTKVGRARGLRCPLPPLAGMLFSCGMRQPRARPGTLPASRRTLAASTGRSRPACKRWPSAPRHLSARAPPKRTIAAAAPPPQTFHLADDEGSEGSDSGKEVSTHGPPPGVASMAHEIPAV